MTLIFEIGALLSASWVALTTLSFVGVPLPFVREPFFLLIQMADYTFKLAGLFYFQGIIQKREDREETSVSASHIAWVVLGTAVPTILLWAGAFLENLSTIWIYGGTYNLLSFAALAILNGAVFSRPLPHASVCNGRIRVMVVGAGEAGSMVVRDMLQEPHYRIVGFVDDDPKKQGTVIDNVPVLGTVPEIKKISEELHVSEILVAIPSATGEQLRRIFLHCGRIRCKVVPGVMSIIRGEARLDQVRKFRPEDILGRETYEPSREQLEGSFSEKRILVTGAAGSIGSQICRELIPFNPESLVLFDNSELRLDTLSHELRPLAGDRIQPVLGDLRDKCKIEQTLQKYRPDVVFHVAAYKHLPMMELNPGEAVRNNVFATKNLVEVSTRENVEKFIFISTDKAVNPISILGVTKRVAEKIVLAHAGKGPTRFMIVRFGNVLASRGSVVHQFMNQIEKEEPLTLTHPDIIRFFMTIREATLLVLQAASVGTDGEIFVLDMGQPIKIMDIAKTLINLCGLEPGKDIPIHVTGLRPGEKLKEELLTRSEEVRATPFEKLYRVPPNNGYHLQDLNLMLEELQTAARQDDPAEIKKALKKIIPSYVPFEKVQEIRGR